MERVSINELTTVPKWIMVCRSGYVRQQDSLQSLNRDIYARVIIMMIYNNNNNNNNDDNDNNDYDND